jgi:hypothetical protein
LLKDVSGIVQDVLRNNVVGASDEVANDPNVPDEVRNAAQRTKQSVENNDLQGAAYDLKNQATSKAQQAADQAKSQGEGYKQNAEQKGNEAANRANDTAEATKRTAGDNISQGATLRDTAKAIVDVVADKAEQHLPEQVVNEGSAQTRDAAAKLYRGEASPQDFVNQAKGQAQGTAQQVKSQISQQVAPLQETGVRVAQQLADLPPEKRDEIIRKFKAVAKTLQSKPEFQRAFDDLTSLLRDVSTKAAVAADTVVQSVAEAPTNPQELETTEEAKLAAINAKKLIENFAGGKKLDSLIKAVSDFADQARNDAELQVFWADLSTYITASFTDPAFVEQTDYDKKAQELVQRARKDLSKYDYYTQKITYESANYADALANDRATQRVVGDANALFADLFLDERGKPAFKPELLRDLATCVPAIADKLAYLPIPRTEMDDGTYHMIFDNIVLHSTILPKYVHLVTDTTIDATQKDPNAQLNNSINLEISHISVSARDIAWLFNKHSGFFKAGDVGLADFDIKDPGLTIKLKLVPGRETGRAAGTETGGRFLHIEQIETTLHNIDLRLHDSHHDFLYKVAKPLLNTRVKKAIEEAVTEGLKDLIFNLDGKLAGAAQSASRGVVDGPEPVKGLPEWGSKAFDVKH